VGELVTEISPGSAACKGVVKANSRKRISRGWMLMSTDENPCPFFFAITLMSD
jgi:hypothetical protein